MDELIQKITTSVGIPADTARSAVGGVLKLIQKQADGADFAQLTEKLPGAEKLLQGAPAPAGGGGMLGSLANAASSLTGGKVGSALDLMGMLKGAGLNLDQAGSFGATMVTFLKDRLGEDLAGRLLAGIPQLKKLLG